MTPKEALDALMSAIPDIENYDEHFSTLGNLISATDVEGAETENEWKQKFMDLREKYRERFRENVFGGESGEDSPSGLDGVEESMGEETPVAELRDLDFDGRSE